MIFKVDELGSSVNRRITIPQKKVVPVYPSFIQMRKFEMYAISNRLTDIGVKKIRRIGHTMEFDQIREYVPGNDEVLHLSNEVPNRDDSMLLVPVKYAGEYTPKLHQACLHPQQEAYWSS